MQHTILLVTLCALSANAEPSDLRGQAAEGLRKAVGYFLSEVSTEGGYLWVYSEDLSKREGEGKAAATQVWVQPPGTPWVGAALLQAFRDTDDKYYLDAARRAGVCLARGQLRSGGWDYLIEFDPKRRGTWAYRLEPAPGKQNRNVSTLDDNNTQSAVGFLEELDELLGFRDARIHETVQYALAALLAAQYPNGAWPQRFDAPADPKTPVKKASYPDTWSRTFPHQKYGGHYTFNDDVMGDMVETLLRAARIYGDERYHKAALRTGDFMILAQLPNPQPGWAQQYDLDMHPTWARKFEPPAITGGESADVMRTLLRLYRESGDKKYLEPIPRALAYYRSSLLTDGRLARFYELSTNKPLYFTKDYQLTYSDADMPTHYSFKGGNWLPGVETEYQRLLKLDPEKLQAERAARSAKPGKRTGKVNRAMEQRVRRVLAAMDSRRWIEQGQLERDKTKSYPVIRCDTFINNIRILSGYLAAGK